MRSERIERKRRPTHPGEILQEDILPAMGLNQAELARRLGVSRRAINELCQEKRGVSVDMAHRLGRFFGNGAAFWLRMQQAIDIWDTEKAKKKEYEKIKPLQAA